MVNNIKNDENVVDVSKFSQEQAKAFTEEHFGTCPPQEIGDLLTKWEAADLIAKGVLVPISKEEVFNDMRALRSLKTADSKKSRELVADLIAHYEKNCGVILTYFKDTQIGAVYNFPGKPENECAFVGYKLLYFKPN